MPKALILTCELFSLYFFIYQYTALSSHTVDGIKCILEVQTRPRYLKLQ